MTVNEARKLIAVFMVTYPNYKPIDVEFAATTWANIMQDYEYEQVNMALNIYMRESTSGFAPTPGQLIDKIQTITQPQELNEMEAWALVSKALKRSANNSAEEYFKLPPLVRKAVGLPEQLRTWSMDENFNEEVAMSQFQRCYRTELSRKKEVDKLPSDMQKLIQNTIKTSPVAQIQAEIERNNISLDKSKNVLETKMKHFTDDLESEQSKGLVDELEEEWFGCKRGD